MSYATIPTCRPEMPQAIVISPGPCTPNEAGISMRLVEDYSGKIPILGICLGHQCIGQVFGGTVTRALRPMHGEASLVRHTGSRILQGLPSPLSVGRYHSLIVELDDDAGPLQATAWSQETRSWRCSTASIRPSGFSFTPSRS